LLLIIAIVIEVLILLVLIRDPEVSGFTKFCAVILTILIFIPDPIPYIDEILLFLVVLKDPVGAAKLLALVQAGVWVLTGLMP